MVAGAKGALLNDLRREVNKAIEQGTTLKEFQAQFDQIVARRGWSYTGDRDWRSNLIWETNLRSAYGKGREAQMQQVKSRRPYAQWRHGGSADPRPEHIENDGRVYLVDERPTNLPHGFFCRCVWLTLSQRDMDRLDLSLSDPLPVPEEPGWSQRLGLPTQEERLELQAQVIGRLHPAIATQVAEEVAATAPEPITYTDFIERGRQWIGEDDLNAIGTLSDSGIPSLEAQGASRRIIDRLLDDGLDAVEASKRADEFSFSGLGRERTIEVREHISEFLRLTKGRVSTLSEFIFTDSRAHASRNGEINVGQQSSSYLLNKQTLFHEAGHHFEFSNERVLNAAKAWIESRREGPDQRLSVLTGQPGYGPGEVAVPDKFIDPYVGKVYARATEVVSVGLENFTDRSSIMELARRDLEHFLLIIGFLL